MSFCTQYLAQRFKRHLRQLAPWGLAGFLALPALTLPATEGLKIPNLGESSTSLFSADYEYNLGQWWLKSFLSTIFWNIVEFPLKLNNNTNIQIL